MSCSVSDGFGQESCLYDFPVRDKKTVLHIRRRRWTMPDGTTMHVDLDQKGHAAEWILQPQNVGTDNDIDETSLQGELYTIIHNKEGHGRKGSIIAVVKGTNPSDVLKVLMQLPEGQREQVKSVSMDLSDSMRAITKEAFPKSIAIRDCFHVVKRGGEACEEIRLRLKRDAVKKLNKDKAEFHKHLEQLASQRKAYRERTRYSTTLLQARPMLQQNL